MLDRMISKEGCNCKVGRLPDEVYRKVQQLRDEGQSYKELADYTRRELGHEKGVSDVTLMKHFNNCGLRVPKSVEDSRLHPQHLAKVVEDKIEMCDDLIEDERDSEDPDKRVLAKLMDTQRRLIDKQLENQQMYLEHQEDSPEKVIEVFNDMVEKGGLSKSQQLKLLRALEEDLGYRE